jgi:hypothetical protein
MAKTRLAHVQFPKRSWLALVGAGYSWRLSEQVTLPKFLGWESLTL